MPWLKATAVLAAVACAALVGVGRGHAQTVVPTRVVLLEDPADPPAESLVQALRIQLSGLCGLEPTPLEPGAVPREQALPWAREPGTLAVVWLPTGAGLRAREATELRVLGADTTAQGEPVLREELVRVPGGPRSDVERGLALKVRELADALRRGRASARQAKASATGDGVPPAAGAADPIGAALGPAFALGARVAPLSGRAQWGGLLVGGAAWRSRSLRLVGAFELSWFPAIELTSGPARARVRELAPGVFARAELRRAALCIGAHGGLGLSFVHAEGSDGRERGEATTRLVSARGGLHVELAIAAGLGLYFGVDLQARLGRQRFTVDGVQLVDFGRLRPLATLALAWSGPALR